MLVYQRVSMSPWPSLNFSSQAAHRGHWPRSILCSAAGKVGRAEVGGDLGKGGVVARIQWGLQHFTRVSNFFWGVRWISGVLPADGLFFLLANQGFETTNPQKNQRIGVRRKVIPQSLSWKEMEKLVTNPKKTNVLNDGQGIGGVYPTSISSYPLIS